jgi:hypothetical protein
MNAPFAAIVAKNIEITLVDVWAMRTVGMVDHITGKFMPFVGHKLTQSYPWGTSSGNDYGSAGGVRRDSL